MADPPRTGKTPGRSRTILVACLLLLLAGLVLFAVGRPDPWPDRIYEVPGLPVFSNPPVLPYRTAPGLWGETVEGEWAGEVYLRDARGRRVTRVTIQGESTDLMWWERFREAVNLRRARAVYEERPDESVGKWTTFERIE